MNTDTGQRIQSICEPLSMNSVWVGGTINGMIVDRIEHGYVYQCGDPYDYYIAWTIDNKKVCEFRKESVNVFYYP